MATPSTPLTHFPELTPMVFDDGMRVVLIEHPFPPSKVVLHLAVSVGSVDESNAEQGLAHFLEHCVFLSTSKFPTVESMRKEMTDLCMDTGADSNAYTDSRKTVYISSAPSNSLSRALVLLREICLKSELKDSDGLETERAAVLSEAAMRRTVGARVEMAEQAQIHCETILPRRFPIGREYLIRKWKAQECINFYRKHYIPSNMTLYVAGDVSKADALVALKEAFGSTPSPVPPTPLFSVPSGSSTPITHNFATPPSSPVVIVQSTQLSALNITLSHKLPMEVEAVRTRGDVERSLWERVLDYVFDTRASRLRTTLARPPFDSWDLRSEAIASEGCSLRTVWIGTPDGQLEGGGDAKEGEEEDEEDDGDGGAKEEEKEEEGEERVVKKGKYAWQNGVSWVLGQLLSMRKYGIPPREALAALRALEQEIRNTAASDPSVYAEDLLEITSEDLETGAVAIRAAQYEELTKEAIAVAKASAEAEIERLSKENPTDPTYWEHFEPIGPTPVPDFQEEELIEVAVAGKTPQESWKEVSRRLQDVARDTFVAVDEAVNSAHRFISSSSQSATSPTLLGDVKGAISVFVSAPGFVDRSNLGPDLLSILRDDDDDDDEEGGGGGGGSGDGGKGEVDEASRWFGSGDAAGGDVRVRALGRAPLGPARHPVAVKSGSSNEAGIARFAAISEEQVAIALAGALNYVRKEPDRALPTQLLSREDLDARVESFRERAAACLDVSPTLPCTQPHLVSLHTNAIRRGLTLIRRTQSEYKGKGGGASGKGKSPKGLFARWLSDASPEGVAVDLRHGGESSILEAGDGTPLKLEEFLSQQQPSSDYEALPPSSSLPPIQRVLFPGYNIALHRLSNGGSVILLPHKLDGPTCLVSISFQGGWSIEGSLEHATFPLPTTPTTAPPTPVQLGASDIGVAAFFDSGAGEYDHETLRQLSMLWGVSLRHIGGSAHIGVAGRVRAEGTHSDDDSDGDDDESDDDDDEEEESEEEEEEEEEEGVSGHVERFDKFLELTRFILENGRVDAAAFERAKLAAVASSRGAERDLDSLSQDIFNRVQFRSNPLASPPRASDLQKVTLEMAREAVARQFDTRTMVVFVSGDFEPEATLESIVRYLGSLGPGPLRPQVGTTLSIPKSLFPFGMTVENDGQFLSQGSIRALAHIKDPRREVRADDVVDVRDALQRLLPHSDASLIHHIATTLSQRRASFAAPSRVILHSGAQGRRIASEYLTTQFPWVRPWPRGLGKDERMLTAVAALEDEFGCRLDFGGVVVPHPDHQPRALLLASAPAPPSCGPIEAFLATVVDAPSSSGPMHKFAAELAIPYTEADFASRTRRRAHPRFMQRCHGIWASVLRMRTYRHVREARGLVYAVTYSNGLSHSKWCTAQGVLDATPRPELAAPATAAVLFCFFQMAMGRAPITPTELEEAVAPIIEELLSQSGTGRFWTSRLADSTSHPVADYAELMNGLVTFYRHVDAADVNFALDTFYKPYRPHLTPVPRPIPLTLLLGMSGPATGTVLDDIDPLARLLEDTVGHVRDERADAAPWAGLGPISDAISGVTIYGEVPSGTITALSGIAAAAALFSFAAAALIRNSFQKK